MGSFMVDPIRKFQIKNQVCPLLSKNLIATVANNQPWVTGIAGKRIRVMGWVMQTNDATTPASVNVLDGSGGTILDIINPPVYGQPREKLDICDSGYMETSTGNGLFVSVASKGALLTVFYIVYTP